MFFNPWLFPLVLYLNAIALSEAMMAASLQLIVASTAFETKHTQGRWEGNVHYNAPFGVRHVHRYSVTLAPVTGIDRKCA